MSEPILEFNVVFHFVRVDNPDETSDKSIGYAYFDNFFQNQDQIEEPIEEHKVFRFPNLKLIPKTSVRTIPPDSKLVFQIHEKKMSENGIPCLRNAGFGFVWLKDIILEFIEHKQNKVKTKLAVLLNVTTEAGEKVKGSIIHVTINDIRHLGETVSDPSIVDRIFDPVKSYHDVEENLDTMKNFIIGWVTKNRNDNYYNGKQLNRSVLGEQIICLTCPSESRPSHSNLPLPLSSYMMYETPLIEICFFINCLLNMAKMRSFSLSSFLDYYLSSNIKQRAAILVLMACQYPQSMEYVTDSVGFKEKTREIDSFDNALNMKCGDCEDLSSAAIRILEAFAKANIDKLVKSYDTKHLYVSKEKLIKVLKDLQHILSLYISFFTITGVNAQKLGKSINDLEAITATGAHAVAIFIPKNYFIECVARWNNKHPLVTEFKRTENEDLEILIGEGTGMLFPIAVDEAEESAKLKQFVYNIDSAQPFKKMVFYQPGRIGFYISIEEMFTNLFFDKYGIGGFKAYKILQNGDLEIAYPFDSFLSKPANVMFAPMGGLNHRSNSKNGIYKEFLSLEIKMMRAVTKTMIPSPILKCPDLEREDTGLEIPSKEFEMIKQALNLDNDDTKMKENYNVEELQLFTVLNDDLPNALKLLKAFVDEISKKLADKKKILIIKRAKNYKMNHSTSHTSIAFVFHIAIRKN